MSDEVRVKNSTTGGEKGSKLARFDLLPWDELEEVAEHYGKGAEKYEPNNWRKGYDWSLSIAALTRHLAAFVAGQDTDEETGSPHLAAVVFHALALMYFSKAHPELDDRFATRDDLGPEAPAEPTDPPLVLTIGGAGQSGRFREVEIRPLRDGDWFRGEGYQSNVAFQVDLDNGTNRISTEKGNDRVILERV